MGLPEQRDLVADQPLAEPPPRDRFPFLRAVAILLLFGMAFGYLEAAVVSYLRILHEPARRHFIWIGRPVNYFPS